VQWPDRADGTETAAGSRYALLAAATAGVALVGYFGHVFYPRFDLPAGTGVTLCVLAAGAGIASFFSPCSFPRLVSMLARPIAAYRTARRGNPKRPREKRAPTDLGTMGWARCV
jgi:hypothetical protein